MPIGPRTTDYVNEVRANTKKFWEAWEALMEAQREWNALDYSNTLPDVVVNDQTFTRSMVGAVVFDTANAIKTEMEAGHATNVAKLL